MDMEYEYLDEICSCGEKKRIQDEICNKCQKYTLENFRNIIKENFEREQIEYLDTVLEGEYIEDFVFGRRV